MNQEGGGGVRADLNPSRVLVVLSLGCDLNYNEYEC